MKGYVVFESESKEEFRAALIYVSAMSGSILCDIASQVREAEYTKRRLFGLLNPVTKRYIESPGCGVERWNTLKRFLERVILVPYVFDEGWEKPPKTIKVNNWDFLKPHEAKVDQFKDLDRIERNIQDALTMIDCLPPGKQAWIDKDTAYWACRGVKFMKENLGV